MEKKSSSSLSSFQAAIMACALIARLYTLTLFFVFMAKPDLFAFNLQLHALHIKMQIEK